jgi:hypothetical protein
MSDENTTKKLSTQEKRRLKQTAMREKGPYRDPMQDHRQVHQDKNGRLTLLDVAEQVGGIDRPTLCRAGKILREMLKLHKKDKEVYLVEQYENWPGMPKGALYKVQAYRRDMQPMMVQAIEIAKHLTSDHQKYLEQRIKDGKPTKKMRRKIEHNNKMKKNGHQKQNGSARNRTKGNKKGI